jgi:hypothetical protein
LSHSGSRGSRTASRKDRIGEDGLSFKGNCSCRKQPAVLRPCKGLTFGVPLLDKTWLQPQIDT